MTSIDGSDSGHTQIAGDEADPAARVRAQRVRAARLLEIAERIDAETRDDDPYARAVVERLRAIAVGEPSSSPPAQRDVGTPDTATRAPTDAAADAGVGDREK